jgi:hypothetical protein
MADRSNDRSRQPRTVPVRTADTAPTTPEPPVHRWPHPVSGTEPAKLRDPALHYIRCALSYQNQLLAEIKTLLEQLAAPTEEK